MNSEIAVFTAIALAVTLHVQPHLPRISLEAFSRAQAEAALCQPLEYGMPCMERSDQALDAPGVKAP